MLKPLKPSACLLLLLFCTAPAAPTEREEQWYRVDFGDVPAGWMVDRQARDAGRLTSESVLHFRFSRGGAPLTVEIASRFVEGEGGRPLEMWTRQSLGPTPIETRYDFLADGVRVTTTQGEQQKEQRLPLPAGDWLTPGELGPRLDAMLASDVDEHAFRIVDPQMGVEPLTVTWTRQARGLAVTAGGRTHTVSRWRQTTSLDPLSASLVDVAADGTVVRSTIPILGGTMTVTLSSQAEALAAEGAPELLAHTFIRPDRVIARPRRARRAVYEVYVDVGEVPDLPSVGYQRAERLSPSAVRVTVDLGAEPAPAAPEEAGSTQLLRASIYVDHEDPEVRRLLARAIRGAGDDPGERAEALRAFVGRHVADKNLDSVLASASEVARSGAGDCTEHTVLLAALLRADGTPARAVAGLLYVDDFAGHSRLFGYHMWVQALVAGRWSDLDATLPAPFDAAHVALGTVALDDDQGAVRELARLAPLIGRAGIRIVDVDHGPPVNGTGE